MNAEMKKKWVEGLRSNRYEQVTGYLFDGTYEDPEGHTIVRCCALGVLNDISGMGYWRGVDGYVVEAPEQFDEDSWKERVVWDYADNEDYQVFIDDWLDDEPQVVKPNLADYEASYPDNVVETIRYCFFYEEQLVHQEVMKAAELDAPDPYVEFEGQRRPLHELNDSGVPFEVIADLIEEQL